MKKITNNLINESYYYDVLPNGLKVFYYPRCDFKRSFVMLTVKYGSLNQEFKILGTDEIIKTPAGVAHFLEHKMFEMPGGIDATNLFAELGADVNAYTSYENTSYYFSTVVNFYESLELLLDFVQTPYFKEESVNSEKGIIEQEIISSLDRPASVGYHGILRNLFSESKIIEDIGGTVESINQIDAEILQKCYDVFYHPENMMLIVAGNFDLDQTRLLIETNQKHKFFNNFLKPETIYYIENNLANKKEDFTIMDVHTSTVYFGLKVDLSSYSYTEISKIAVLIDFLLDETIGYGSKNYQMWIREKIIDYSFEYSFSLGDKYGYILVNLESMDEELFLRIIKDAFLNIPNVVYDKTRFLYYIRRHCNLCKKLKNIH